MGIYSRDNVDYQGMIQNMLANRARGAQIRSQGINRQGEIWGNAVSNIGNIASSTIRDMAAQEEAAKQQELENSWKQQQIDFQNRQLAQQKDLQLQQMALSRELAGQQKAEAEAASKEEYMKDWSLHAARLRYAKAKYGRNPGDPEARRELEEADYLEKYYRTKAGIPDETAAEQIQPNAAPVDAPVQPQLSNADIRAQFDEILARPWTAETLSLAEAKRQEAKNDATLYAQMGKDIELKGMTKEQKEQAAAEQKRKDEETIKNWDGSEVPEGFESYFAGGKEYIRRKKKGK